MGSQQVTLALAFQQSLVKLNQSKIKPHQGEWLMVRRRWTNWQWVFAAVIVVIAVGLLADIATLHFVRQVNAQAAEAVAIQVAQQWDNFVVSAAGHVGFQKTMDIYDELLDPKRREVFLQQSGGWVDEMRKAAGADFWVVMDADSQPVVVLPPTKSGLPSLRPLWKSPLENHFCMAAVFQGANSESALLGVGADLVIEGKKRGELWLLYWLDKVCQRFNRFSILRSFELATLRGEVIFKAKQQHELTNSNSVYTSVDSEQLPLRFTISILSGKFSKDANLLRLLYWFFLTLIALIVAAIIRHRQQISDGGLAIKLTEIFNSLSERFLETHDEAKVLQELAEAITREFRFPIAIVFRMDRQSGKFRAAGYTPRRLLSEILNRYGDISSLTLSEQIIQRLQTGDAYISSSCHEFFNSLPEEAIQTLQNMLHLCWCALLFAEGKPVAAILAGTSQEQLSHEELQALELVRQQAAMLITIITSWEEREKAREQAFQFQNVLLRLSEELSKEDELTNKLELIAKVAQETLNVTQVTIWQVLPDRQHIHCVVAVGGNSEQLKGQTLPMGLSYMVSLVEGRTIAASSVLTDPRTNELSECYWLPYGLKSTIEVPVRVEGEIVSIVCCEHSEEREWSVSEIKFAGNIADFVAKAILESRQRRQEQYLSTLSQIALQLVIATEWQGVVPAFLEDMGKLAEADRAFLAQLATDDQGCEILKCLSVWSADGFVEDEWEFRLDEVGAPYQIDSLKMGEAVFFQTKNLPEPYRQFYERRGVKSVLAVPVFVESRLWGILGFSARSKEHFWGEIDITILKVAGSLLGSVIGWQNAIRRQFEREKEFRNLVENAVVGIYKSTPDGKLLMANPALAQMLGYQSPQELVSSITDLATQVYVNPAHREDFKRMVEEQGAVQNFIAPLKRKDGKVIWAAISGKAVYGSGGEPLHYEGFVLDITARKMAEEMLAQRIAQLQALYRLVSALQEFKELDKILVEAIECIKDALKANSAYVALINPEGKPEIKVSLGISGKAKQAIEDFLTRSFNDLATKTITITDVSQASELGSLQEALLEEGLLSLLCVPIIHNDRLIGRLNASFNRPRKFTENEIELMQTIAHHLAFAVVRKEVEEQIRRSEEEFRSLFENAVIGIYRSTPEGRFLMANETLARIHGYDSVDELMALDIPSQIYLNPEDRERFKKLMVERGFVSDFRYPIKRKDKSIGWLAKWARAVKDDNGNVLYYEGFVLDITEKVKLEQRLNALQATARSLITRLDIDSIVQVAVAEMSRLYPNSAVLVFRYQEESDVFVHEKSNEEAKDLLRALRLSIGATLKRQSFPFLKDRLWSGESILISDLDTAVGSSIKELTELGYNAIFLRGIGDSSQLWGMIGIYCKGKDFTQQDVDFLNSFCDYLSIAVRNASLFQQVRQAYDELRSIQERMLEQERLRALGQIASGIAHDINNALVPIQGFAEILLEHNDPTVRSAAEVIFKSASDITATVQRMREFYRVRSSEDVLEPVNLNAICKDALTMTRPKWFNMTRERGIVIEPQLELSDDLPPLSGMPSEIRQAIVNLIINAVDAMPEGGTLTIRTYRKDRGGRAWAVVEVSDTGIGMDEETKRRATEPFFTTKGERGSGLGLAAVYGTVQRHEGFMEIDSEPGQGTTVRLWFPSNVIQIIELPAGEVPSLKLLVIDDEPSVRETIALMLRKDGHVVATAADGEEGVELFQAAQLQGNQFNAVITDLGMPKLDGLSVARKIKTLAPETPVILLSGWGFKIRAEEMRDVIDAVLVKPTTYQQIRRTLSQIWNKRMALSD